MRASYPNNFISKEKYSISKTWSYKISYPELSEDQIAQTISAVVENIDSLIGYNNSYIGVMFDIAILKQFLEDDYNGENIPIFSNKGFLLSCTKGEVDFLKEILEDRFPEDFEETYSKFLSEMSKDIIREVCNTTGMNIPHTEKLNFERYISDAIDQPSRHTNSSSGSRNFLERILNNSKQNVTDEINLSIK